MRFKSAPVAGFQAFAVTGTNTISFAIQATDAARRDCWVLRSSDRKAADRTGRCPASRCSNRLSRSQRRRRKSRHGTIPFRVSSGTISPQTTTRFTSSFSIRSAGPPAHLDRSAPPVRIKVRTEPLITRDDDDVFFNRGVASSQAYARQFGNKKPSELKPKSKEERACNG